MTTLTADDVGSGNSVSLYPPVVRVRPAGHSRGDPVVAKVTIPASMQVGG